MKPQPITRYFLADAAVIRLRGNERSLQMSIAKLRKTFAEVEEIDADRYAREQRRLTDLRSLKAKGVKR